MYLNIYVMLRTMFPVHVELSQDDYINVNCLNQPKCKNAHIIMHYGVTNDIRMLCEYLQYILL